MSMWNKDKIEDVFLDTSENVLICKEMSDKIIEENSGALDDIMRDINNEIVGKDNPSDDIIEKYFLELTNALYFIGTRIEYFGFYEDISKANLKNAYNEAYTNYQLQNASTGNKKPSAADSQINADMESINESIVNIIYSRSYKILKSKVEMGYEQVRTLSKLLSKHMEEKRLNALNSTNIV